MIGMRRNFMIVSTLALIALVTFVLTSSRSPISALALPETTPPAAPGATSTAVPTSAATPEPVYEGKVTAPEFTFGLDWINVPEPLTMVSLRGKIVLLDFWTYGCINCIHIIPDLKRLEAEYPDELVIIGVHSAKFKNEGSTAAIREIVQRYGVTHPVVNDYDFDIWNAYGAQAWPTLVLIDPAGKVVGFYAGEGVYDVFAPVLRPMVRQWDARKGIDRKPITITPETAKQLTPRPLAYPGKVLADPVGNRLFITDTNNNRVIVTDLKTFTVKQVIGTGAAGFTDGLAVAAEFLMPHGIALKGDTLYVADTGNHAIRAIDLTTGKVSTVAGTGEQAQKRNVEGPGLDTALNSPWDVTTVGDTLYIAMAGWHQLWALDLKSGQVGPFAGSSKEGVDDGILVSATMAQPSGIVSDGKTLYFTDPEASAIRTADIDPKGEVKTIIGRGLFDFGDSDGKRDSALLQHALGVTLAPDGKLYIADTYNHKIKVIDLVAQTVTSYAGKAETGFKDGLLTDARFNEPGGLSYAEGKLYIADTNNNAIRVLDISSGMVSTVTFPNADVLALAPATLSAGDPVPLPEQTVAPGATRIVINITVPAAYKFNATAPFTVTFAPDPLATFGADKGSLQILKPTMPLTILITLTEGQTALTADAEVYYCDAVNERLCYVSMYAFTLPIKVIAGGAKEIRLDYAVMPPKVPNSTFKP